MSQATISASNVQPSENDYGKAEYWDNRYSQLPQFDWLMNYAHFKAHGFTQIFRKEGRFIMLGSGSARFSADMYDDGYENIDNIDISSVVINKEKARNLHRKNMHHAVMDVQNLEYKDEMFDVAIDKSTTDSLLCRADKAEAISNMIHETLRVLKPGGFYVALTLREVETVLPYLERDVKGQQFNWLRIETYKIPNPGATRENGKSETLPVIIARKAENS